MRPTHKQSSYNGISAGGPATTAVVLTSCLMPPLGRVRHVVARQPNDALHVKLVLLTGQLVAQLVSK